MEICNTLPRNIVFDSELSAPAKLIYYTLEKIVHTVTRSIQCSGLYLEKLTGMSVRTILRHIKSLENAGYVHVQRAAKNSKICNIYHVLPVNSASEGHTESVVGSQESLKEEVVSLEEISINTQQPALCDTAPHKLPEFEGIAPDFMRQLVRECGMARVLAAIYYAKKQRNLTNPAGFVIRASQGKIPSWDAAKWEREASEHEVVEATYYTNVFAYLDEEADEDSYTQAWQVYLSRRNHKCLGASSTV